MNAKERLISRASELITQGESILRTAHRSAFGLECVDSSMLAGFRSAALSFLHNIYGDKHPFYSSFNEAASSEYTHNAKASVEILKQVKIEVEGDWILRIKNIVASELFSDFIDMSTYLLEAGYKDPAAVLIGSVLEEHLRQLCKSKSIPISEDKEGKQIPIKADRLNSNLAKAEIYNLLEQKMVTAWLDLRNKAAHGKYSEYDSSQVEQMLNGIIGFINRNPMS